jgi:hypothetical protein
MKPLTYEQSAELARATERYGESRRRIERALHSEKRVEVKAAYREAREARDVYWRLLDQLTNEGDPD